jgi:hypothetical protein
VTEVTMKESAGPEVVGDAVDEQCPGPSVRRGPEYRRRRRRGVARSLIATLPRDTAPPPAPSPEMTEALQIQDSALSLWITASASRRPRIS